MPSRVPTEDNALKLFKGLRTRELVHRKLRHDKLGFTPTSAPFTPDSTSASAAGIEEAPGSHPAVNGRTQALDPGTGREIESRPRARRPVRGQKGGLKGVSLPSIVGPLDNMPSQRLRAWTFPRGLRLGNATNSRIARHALAARSRIELRARFEHS